MLTLWWVGLCFKAPCYQISSFSSFKALPIKEALALQENSTNEREWVREDKNKLHINLQTDNMFDIVSVSDATIIYKTVEFSLVPFFSTYN